MFRYAAVIGAALALNAMPLAAADVQPTDQDIRVQATISEVALQRDAAQTRAARLAGELAVALMKLHQIEAQGKPEAKP